MKRVTNQRRDSEKLKTYFERKNIFVDRKEPRHGQSPVAKTSYISTYLTKT